MSGSPTWSAELTQAAQSLENLLYPGGVPRHEPALEDWELLSGRHRPGIPPWLPPFLATFAVAGSGLLLREHASDEWGVYFEFLTPEHFQGEVVGWIADLPAFGFHAFALGADGDLWIATTEDGPEGAIYLLESSGWNGSQPSLHNGLTRHCESLARLVPQLSLIDDE